MYRIEIVEVTERPTVKREWMVLTSTPKPGEPEYGWATYDGTVQVERKVLAQEVETVDLPAVIKAINNL